MDKKPTTDNRFVNLTFEDFKHLAQDETLSKYEKIGFPNSYREGKEEYIFKDILSKLKNLHKTNQTIVDIGPGCSGLAFMLIEFCKRQGHSLILIDSQEMLDQLPDEPFIIKFPGYFPNDCKSILDRYHNKVHAILTYSVLHYIFAESNLFDFLDAILGLLMDGGELLIGDVPNISKRKRFFSSSNGIAFHKKFMNTDETPVVQYYTIEKNQIDDAVVLSIILRSRSAGFDAYVIPQEDHLPMANRREDILIIKP